MVHSSIVFPRCRAALRGLSFADAKIAKHSLTFACPSKRSLSLECPNLLSNLYFNSPDRFGLHSTIRVSSPFRSPRLVAGAAG